jgi:hypothetical protein
MDYLVILITWFVLPNITTATFSSIIKMTGGSIEILLLKTFGDKIGRTNVTERNCYKRNNR